MRTVKVILSDNLAARFDIFLDRLGHGSKQGPFLRDLLIKHMDAFETGQARELSEATRKAGSAA